MSQEITFSSDGFRLSGTLHLPAAEHPPVVIGLHGLLSDRSSPKQLALAHQCNRVGIAYLRFDHRGCGDSEGDFQRLTSLTGRCNDLMSAVEALQAHGDLSNTIGLFGSSMGGTVCLATAPRLKPAAVAAFAAPIRSAQIVNALKAAEDTDSLPSSFYHNQLQFDIAPKIPAIRNLLILHGDSDEVVPVAHGRETHRQAGEPKRLVIFKGGDHRLSNTEHQEALIQHTLAWFQERFQPNTPHRSNAVPG